MLESVIILLLLLRQSSLLLNLFRKLSEPDAVLRLGVTIKSKQNEGSMITELLSIRRIALQLICRFNKMVLAYIELSGGEDTTALYSQNIQKQISMC